jgi:hypothetical protein
MPKNPATGKDQIYPEQQHIEEFMNLDFGESEEEGKQKVSELHGRYFSFLFAICHSKKMFDSIPTEKRLGDARDLQSKLSEISQNQHPKFSVWLSELIQNAIDAKWDDGLGATEIEIEFKKSEIVFIHNGRPPQYLDYMKNEFQKMMDDGSTKRSDLNNEGKFGIGFKFWSFFFEKVNLESDGWQISWNKVNELSDISKSDFNTGGMKLTFSSAKDSYVSRFQEYEKSFEILFEQDLARLIEGIAVQTTPLKIIVKLEDISSFELDHQASIRKYKLAKTKDTEFYEISNKVSMSNNGNISLYAPYRAIGYDVNKFHSISDFQEIQNIVNTLQLEFKQKTSDPFIRDLLRNDCIDEDWSSEKNLKEVAISHRDSIKCQCMFDIDPKMVKHFVMYSLFSLSHKTDVSGGLKDKLNSRISYIGTYAVNQERTRLEQSNRNKAIVKAQLKSTYLMMNLISNEQFRKDYDISDSIYLEIMSSLEETNFDSEFIDLYKGE